MVFHGSRLVLHCLKRVVLLFMVTGRLFMVPGGFSQFQVGSRLVFHGSKWVFMVFVSSRLVFIVFSLFQICLSGFHVGLYGCQGYKGLFQVSFSLFQVGFHFSMCFVMFF